MFELMPRRAQTLSELREQFEANWAAFRTKRDRAIGRMKMAPADVRVLNKLDGLRTGTRSFLACNGVGRKALAGSVITALQAQRDARPNETWLHVSIMLKRWTTGERIGLIDIDKISREGRSILNLIAPNWSAAIELQAFSNFRHESGGRLVSPHIHAVAWGPGIDETTEAIREEYNPLLPTSTPGILAIDVRRIGKSQLDLAHVARYPLMAPDRNKTLYIHPKTGRVNLHESEAADRYVSYLRMFQLLSRLRQHELMFAAGDGMAIQTRALNHVRRRIRNESMSGGAPLVMPDIQRFWRQFMPRHPYMRFNLPRIIRPQPIDERYL